MLKLKYLFENFDMAKECLKMYDYDTNSIDKMLTYFRISSNAIYPFMNSKLDNQVCFLRISPVEEKSIDDVLSEIHIINWLDENGCHVMQPVPMKNGLLADAIDTKWGRVNVSCFKKVPGKELEETQITMNIIKKYGESLGELHKCLRKYPGSRERRDHNALMDEILTRFIKFGASQLLITEYYDVLKELSNLEVNELNYGICHYDFEPDNVFYDSDLDEMSIIDFDDAIQCWFALDVVRAIDSLEDLVDESKYNEAIEIFIDGYREKVPFEPEQVRTMPLMRRLICLQEYSNILYVLSDPIEEGPEWLVAIKEKLCEKLHSIENALQARGEG